MAARPVNARIGVIPKLRAELKVNAGVGPTQENNDAVGGKAAIARVLPGRAAVLPRRIGLAVIDRNIRRPVLAVTKSKVSPAEVDEEVAPSKAVVTRKISPVVKKAEPEKLDSIFDVDSQMPVQIENFMSVDVIRSLPDPDGDDVEVEILCTEFIKDIMVYLLKREAEMPIATNYMKGHKSLLPRHRRTLVDWLLHLHAKFKLAPETLYLTVYILDAYCQRRNDTTTGRYQLIGMTALVVAAKFEEVYPPSMEDIVAMSDRAFTQDDLLKSEREILRALKFEVNRPTPITFLRRYSKLADVETTVHAMAKFLMELTVLEYELVGVRPSKIAAAALFLALKLHTIEDIDAPVDDANPDWTDTMAYYANYPAEILKPAAYELCALIRKSEQAREKTVLEKYAATKFWKVSKEASLRSRFVTEWASRAKLVRLPEVKPSPPSKTPQKTVVPQPRQRIVAKRVVASSVTVSKAPLATRPPFRP